MRRRGFTLSELVLVMVLMGVLAVAVYPAMRDTAVFALRSASRQLVADIHFAKNLAMSSHAVCGIAFDPVHDVYFVYRGSPATPIDHPLRPGQPHRVDLGAQGIALATASFGSGSELRFDPLGQPLDASGQPFLTAGMVILSRGVGASATVDTITVNAFSGGVSGP